MKKPTEQAIRAARALNQSEKHSEFIQAQAETIDREANLPALLADRDELRKALAEMVYVMAPLESETLTTPFQNARAALAINSKGQP